MGWTSEVSKRDKDKAELVNSYRSLTDEGKQLIRSMIGQLTFSYNQSAARSSALKVGHLPS